MILPLLITAPLPKNRIVIDHAPLINAASTNAAMLAPDREAWAVARLSRTGPDRERELRDARGDGGPALVFDIDLDVLDGWNVPTGALRAFWAENRAGTRRATVARMVGQTVLVRFAPAIDGRYRLVSGTDDAPEFFPTFDARVGERFVATLFPYAGERLEPGEPKWRRWATLWRAGAALSPSAYPVFGSYISAAPLPLTPTWTGKARTDAGGGFLDNDILGLDDVDWLLKLAKRTNPELEMLVAEYLDRHGVAGAVALKRDLVLLALKRPEVFPDGLFRVADDGNLGKGVPPAQRPWLPAEATLATILRTRNPDLLIDLIGLLERFAQAPSGRTRLLTLLKDQDPRVRGAAASAFIVWHGTPPKGTDPVAWHTARAKLSREALEAAKAVPGG